MNSIDDLWNLISTSRHCVAFTGAGVSTLSGIRDFRGKNGLYKTVDTSRMFDIELFRRDPSVYYEMARDFIYDIDAKKPSVVHRVLAELERRGLVHAVITQNIDLLHSRAGSRNVLEIHGSPAVHFCPKCGYKTDFDEAARTVRAGEMPRCPECETVLKPTIVFFGESLPAEAIMRAEEESKAADLMLVLGSSLVVYPAAALPEITVHSGGSIVIVNDMPTGLDRFARMRFEDLGETFAGIESILSRTGASQ